MLRGPVIGSLEWLRQMLVAGELGEHFEKAAAWADENGCVQSDLISEDCLQELIGHLALKRFQAARLRKACAVESLGKGLEDDACSESTAASMAEIRIADEVAELGDGQSVFVEYDCERFPATVQCENADGTFRVIYDEDFTYEDVARERISATALVDDATVGVHAVAEHVTLVLASSVSKSEKKRARKKVRDILLVAEQPKIQDQQQRSKTVAKHAGATELARRVVEESLVESFAWSVRREGCKSYAEVALPAKFLGWVIGKNGSTIRHIEQTFLVTVQIVSQNVLVAGKQERVKRAMAHIDHILWGGV